MRRPVFVTVLATVLALPGVAAAQQAADPPTPDGDPASTETTLPLEPPAPPATAEPVEATPEAAQPETEEDAAETAVTVGTEQQYRDAITTLSGDNSGPHTITLTADITLAAATDPTYTGTQPLTIDGAGFFLDGGLNSRVLLYDSAPTTPLTLENITVQNGRAEGTGTQRGGAVFTTSSIVVRDATFTGNRAVSTDGGTSGGAIYARDDLDQPISVTIEDSEFSDNAADGQDGISVAGALSVGTVTTLDVTGSTFDTNSSKNELSNANGGAISGNADTIHVSDSDLLNNTIVAGGNGGGGALSLVVGVQPRCVVRGSRATRSTRPPGPGEVA
jgi:hypothetical protein